MSKLNKGALQIILSISLILLLGFIFEINNYCPPWFVWITLVTISFVVTLKGLIKFCDQIEEDVETRKSE